MKDLSDAMVKFIALFLTLQSMRAHLCDALWDSFRGCLISLKRLFGLCMRSMLEEETVAAVDQARKELQWESEKKSVALRKLKWFFFDPLEVSF